MSKLFGTDGIRGVANRSPMLSEELVHVARATAKVVGAKKVILGKDTRRSCYMIETALSSGFCSMGTDVLLVGPMPTPGIAFLTHSMRADAGVVISASHNPYHDNGVKIFNSHGFKLSDEHEAQVEKLCLEALQGELPTLTSDVGRVTRVADVRGRYIVFLKNTFPDELSLDGMKIVLDCANGAAYKIAPLVLEELGAELICLGVEPNGRNINDGVGALYPEKLATAVKEQGADLGIALDGDGDRLILVDDQGGLVDGDTILAVMAKHWKSENRLKKNTVVVTKMSNHGLTVSLQREGIDLVYTDVGDRYVVQAMRESGFNLGGEQSGHIVMLDYNTTGDGMLSALQMLAVMQKSKKKLSQLRQWISIYPQVLLNVPVAEKKEFSQLPGTRSAIESAETKLGDEGRVFVRYSGTEKLARVMVEGPSQELIQQLADAIAESINREIGIS